MRSLTRPRGDALSTAFTRLVGSQLPIQQAPIGFAAALPELPLAVAAAGGHGMLAGVRMPTADLAERLRAIRAQTRAFGVNLIEPLLEEGALETAAEHAPVVELYLGAPTAATVERASAGGALVSW
jgi:nitronate monooxygenase